MNILDEPKWLVKAAGRIKWGWIKRSPPSNAMRERETKKSKCIHSFPCYLNKPFALNAFLASKMETAWRVLPLRPMLFFLNEGLAPPVLMGRFTPVECLNIDSCSEPRRLL